IALFIAANVRDTTPRQRLGTMLLTLPSAFLATALAALLYDQPVASAALLPLIMFGVAYGATLGARWASLGTVTLIAYFMGLVTHAPPATLPMRFVVLLIAAGAAALIRLMLLPERPRAELARLHAAIHAGLVRVLDRIAAAVAAGTWTASERERLHQDIARLDETVMLSQARVATIAAELPGTPNPWLHLLTIQLGAERVARVALSDLGSATDRPRLLEVIAAMRRGTRSAETAAGQLGTALALLDSIMHDETGAAPAAAPPPASAPQGLRAALQTAVATALAIGAGNLVSPNRWYWAAFAAYVMFQGTRSRGEALVKGMRFVVGTLAGVLFGMLLATALSGHELLSLAAIVLAVFLAFQANVAAYGRMVFWITVILGLLFGMLGFFPPDLLLLRLKESAVGAACGALVACAVLVVRGRSAIGAATNSFLRPLGQSVDAAARTLLDGAASADLAACVLASEQRYRDLAAIAHSERLGLAAAPDEPVRRNLLVLEGCELWTRELGQIALQGGSVQDPALVGIARDAVAHIDAAINVLVDPAADPPTAAAVEVRRDDLPREVRLLLRISAALAHFAITRNTQR
ncbi:MAG TPA: FUSC family protein, partial [Acetobacteraceae bacterium]|nr:FUSC family protein [Acetobacteraceae bacterium]